MTQRYTDPATGRQYEQLPDGSTRWVDNPPPPPSVPRPMHSEPGYAQPQVTGAYPPHGNQHPFPGGTVAIPKKHTARNVIFSLVGAVVVLGLLGSCLAAIGNMSRPAASSSAATDDATGPQSTSAKPAATNPAASSKAAPSSKAAGVVESDGWQLVSSKISKQDFTGQFQGTIRVKNTEGDERSAFITLTLLKPGTQDVIATLAGAVNNVAGGATATATLLSTDKYLTGKYDITMDVTST